MSDIGFNDNLEVGGRKFHFQTETSSGKGKIRCEIFEEGRILSSTEVDFDRRKGGYTEAVEERLRQVVESLHEEMISEVELLFKIADKVAKLKHSPSNVKVGIMFLQNNMIDDAIKQANSLNVSFQAAVFSTNIDTCMYAFKQLNASAVMINDHTAFRVDWMPFAGLRESGLGVGGISHTIRDMQTDKMMVVNSKGLI